MYAAWNRVAGEVDSWSRRLDLVLQSEEVEVDERVNEEVEVEVDELEEELDEEQEEV
jgi:hypothetical protein